MQNNSTMAQRTGLIVILTLASIAFHEFGHFFVYWLGDCPVRVSLQSIRPICEVGAPLNLFALAAGPAFSLMAAAACWLVARRNPSFLWITAAFINASTLRLFPLGMDILRAIKNAKPFSDEGYLVIAITTNAVFRALLLLVIFAVFLSLSVVVARLYNFEKHRTAKVVGIYCLSLAVALGVVLADELLKVN